MFEYCLTFFQLCGFYPIIVRNFEEKRLKFLTSNIFLSVRSFIHISLVLTLIIYVSIFNESVLYAETPIGKFNDILVLFSLLFAHLSIIVESFVKRRFYIKYWIYFEKLQRIGKRPKERKWQRFLFIKLVTFVTFSTVVELLVITNIGADPQWTTFWYFEVFSLLITRNRHFQHIFFIDIIFFTLEDMNLHMRNSIAWSKAVGEEKSCSKKFLFRKVSQTKEKFKNLMEMLICVNRVFAWSQVLNFGQHFIEVTSELYWVYAFATGPEFLWATLIVFLPTILVFVLLLHSANRCIKEIHEKTSFVVHDIHIFVKDEKLRSLIIDFSLLIKQSPKHFTAKNFFAIDFTLLGGVLSAMMTYLLIFISFQPKEDEIA